MTSSATPRPRVAIVDDEQDVLTFLRLVLEDAGFEVLACGGPEQAVENMVSFRPDLICLDLLMPQQLGLSLFDEIRERPCLERVPVVILTGCTTPTEMRESLTGQAKRVPPAAWLEKPIEPAVLLPLVTRLAGLRAEAPS